MVFSTLLFLFYFLPIFLFFYYISPKNVFFKNVIFLAASLFFYFWGEKIFICVLIFSILTNYCIGLALQKESNNRKIFLALGIALNILVLILFKYTPFIAENIANLFNIKNIQTPNWNLALNVHLPLGISFFTFQGVSYIIDIYRKDAEAETSLLNLGLYISMFPQLIAGPIVRFKEISKSIKKRTYSISSIVHGINLFIIGLAYKVLLANTVALPADKIFALGEKSISFGLAWMGTICYTLQIYFDFCGYSTMAIGLGLMLGIKFPVNFNFPYIAQSITEFWRRWHITLSQWFRDYLYIPLGGNRLGDVKTYRNLLLVFALCGIWHGASWAFIIWGLYHGFFLVIERLGVKQILNKIPSLFRYVYTILVVMIGWVFFRADTFDKAYYFLKAMFGFGIGTENAIYFTEVIQLNVIIAIFLGFFLATPIINNLFFGKKRGWSTLSELSAFPKSDNGILWHLLLFAIFLLCIFSLTNQTYNPFIYFRF